MNAAQPGTVYLVGAGPGDPGLLTRRAGWLLETATCILHDDLVSDEVLQLAVAATLLRNVGKRCGRKSITQEEIHALMAACAREGHSVVRLKSGDPTLFGRAGEEIDALRQAAIPFEVVPGITAALAAAASLRISLTDRRGPSQVLLSSGHHARTPATRTEPLAPDTTLVRYMPGTDYQGIARDLLDAGWPGTSLCFLVSSAGRPGQSICQATVDTLAQIQPLPAPVVMIIQPQQDGASRTLAAESETAPEGAEWHPPPAVSAEERPSEHPAPHNVL